MSGDGGDVGAISAPSIVKPALAARVAGNRLDRGGARYLLDDAALQEALAGFAAESVEGPLLLQPLIRGTGEGVFGFATAEGVAHWSGHERLRMMNPHGSGSSACRARDPEPELRARVEAMMTALGWRGPFMVELLRDAEGVPWFMELNGRLWGSMALARRNGFEYPAWAAEAAFDPAFRPVRGAERLDEARHLGREILHLLFLARGPRTAFHRAGWPSWRASLAGVLRPHAARGFYNHDPDLPRFFLRDAWETVADATWRRRR